MPFFSKRANFPLNPSELYSGDMKFDIHSKKSSFIEIPEVQLRQEFEARQYAQYYTHFALRNFETAKFRLKTIFNIPFCLSLQNIQVMSRSVCDAI